MRMPSRSRLVAIALGAIVVLRSPALGQQVAVASPEAQRLRITTKSEAAGHHFWAGLSDTRNWFLSRATGHFDEALALDSTLGLARVVRAFAAPGLTTDQRNAEAQRGIAAMTAASTGELVTALAFREAITGNNRQAQRLFETASQMLPGDPNIAFYAALFINDPTQQIPALRTATERFPDDAAMYNTLAYQLWATGDHAGAFAAVKRYVDIAPDQPNSHDSYAELLQWDRRYSEALTHYRRAVAIDSNFVESNIGMAEVLQVTGRGEEARQQIHAAIARAPDPESRVNYEVTLAHSFTLDGRLTDAMAQFAVVARDAQAIGRKQIAAQAHRDMALADAVLGRGTDIARHLAVAAQTDTTEPAQQLYATALAQGTSGDIATARQAAAQLATVAKTDSNYTTWARVANAVISLRENKPNDALTELAGANPDRPMVQAIRAEADRAIGNTVDAQALRRQLIDDPQINLYNGFVTFARVRAGRIKP